VTDRCTLYCPSHSVWLWQSCHCSPQQLLCFWWVACLVVCLASACAQHGTLVFPSTGHSSAMQGKLLSDTLVYCSCCLVAHSRSCPQPRKYCTSQSSSQRRWRRSWWRVQYHRLPLRRCKAAAISIINTVSAESNNNELLVVACKAYTLVMALPLFCQVVSCLLRCVYYLSTA